MTRSMDQVQSSVSSDISDSHTHSEEEFDIFKDRVLDRFTRLLIEPRHHNIINPFPFRLSLASTHIDNDITSDDNSFSPLSLKSCIEATRKKGGGFNHITQLTLRPSVSTIPRPQRNPYYRYPHSRVSRGGIGSAQNQSEYIWRTPKSRGTDVTRTALILNYLRHHTPLPVPKVLAFSADKSDLADRYILTDLVPGEPLEDVLCSGLDLQQRLELADIIAGLTSGLLTIEIKSGDGLIGEVCVDGHHHHAEYELSGQNHGHYRTAVIIPDESDSDSDSERLIVRSFPFNERPWSQDLSMTPNSSDRDLAVPTTLRSYILTRLHQRYADAVAVNQTYFMELYERLLVVAERLLDPERTPEVNVMMKPVLVHTDLMPRNIMVSFNGGERRPRKIEQDGKQDVSGWVRQATDADGDDVCVCRFGNSGWKPCGAHDDREINRESNEIWRKAIEVEGEETEKSSCPLPTLLGLPNQSRHYTSSNNKPISPLTPPSSTSSPSSPSSTSDNFNNEPTSPLTPPSSKSSTPDEITVTSILDWDDPQAWPPLMAYVLLYPSWLWDSSHEDYTSYTSTYTPLKSRARKDLALETMSSDDTLVKARCERELEARIPGYMAIVRSANEMGLTRLIWYASTRIMGKWEAHGIAVLEKLADERDMAAGRR